MFKKNVKHLTDSVRFRFMVITVPFRILYVQVCVCVCVCAQRAQTSVNDCADVGGGWGGGS